MRTVLFCITLAAGSIAPLIVSESGPWRLVFAELFLQSVERVQPVQWKPEDFDKRLDKMIFDTELGKEWRELLEIKKKTVK
jgi:hypothetical protein